jgi:IPT/TIG domain
MELARFRYKSIDGKNSLVVLIGLVFLCSGDLARGQGNPDPRVTSITPNFAVAGGPGFTLTVSGFNFVSGSVVRWNGANRTTTVVNSFQLNATIASGDIAAAGTVSVTVFNPPPGGGSSNALDFTIQPVPRITSINPASALAGGAAFTLTVVGTNFYSPDPDTGGGGSRVQWNGSDRSTSYGGNTQLTASILASDLATAGTATVTVFTPGIGTSNPATFTINNRAPQITAINPASAAAAGPAFNLTVTGTGFFSGSVVRWNGAARPTTLLPGASPTLGAAIPASDIATAGTATITVFNPAPGGGSSNGVSFTVFGNPVPRITSLEPASAAAGGPAFILTVNGSGFVRGDPIESVPGSVVRWNSTNRTTTFVSNTRLTAAITAGDIATAGTAIVTVFNPTPGGGASNEVSFVITPTNPVPTITSLNPSTATAGSPAFALTVTGTNFVSGSVVRWNDSDRPTAFVTSTQLTAAIPATDIAAAGPARVRVFNPAPGGGPSNEAGFVIAPANPAPTITSLNPSTATAGSAAFTLTVTGTNFVTGSAVRWNGANRPTTFVSGTQLTAAIPAGDIATSGTASITVFNPTPGGGTSNAVDFTILQTNPAPTITGLNPSSATAGSAAFTLSVTGANFVSGSVVRWNGANRPTTFGNSTQLTAAIPATDIATAGTASVAVFNPAPGGGTSNAVAFTISQTNPVPTITGLNPASATAGSPAFTLAVTGTNFVSGSMVRWNGANRTTIFVNATQLTAAIPAGDIATSGTANVVVFNPAPGGGVSNAQNFSVLPPPQVTIGGVGDSLDSREQPSVNLTLSAAQTGVLNGQLILTFMPEAVNPSDDPAIVFISSQGRVLNFTFPASSTQAVFAGAPSAMFQTGSVAGTINLSVFLEGVLNASRNITIRRQAPTIRNVSITSRTASSFELVIDGLSNIRVVNQGEFRFGARGGGNLATTVVPVSLTNDANSWFQEEASRPFGSQFTLVVVFNVQGDVSAIGSVSVTLSNGEGTSAQFSASF